MNYKSSFTTSPPRPPLEKPNRPPIFITRTRIPTHIQTHQTLKNVEWSKKKGDFKCWMSMRWYVSIYVPACYIYTLWICVCGPLQDLLLPTCQSAKLLYRYTNTCASRETPTRTRDRKIKTLVKVKMSSKTCSYCCYTLLLLCIISLNIRPLDCCLSVGHSLE